MFCIVFSLANFLSSSVMTKMYCMTKCMYPQWSHIYIFFRGMGPQPGLAKYNWVRSTLPSHKSKRTCTDTAYHVEQATYIMKEFSPPAMNGVHLLETRWCILCKAANYGEMQLCSLNNQQQHYWIEHVYKRWYVVLNFMVAVVYK